MVSNRFVLSSNSFFHLYWQTIDGKVAEKCFPFLELKFSNKNSQTVLLLSREEPHRIGVCLEVASPAPVAPHSPVKYISRIYYTDMIDEENVVQKNREKEKLSSPYIDTYIHM